MRADVSEIFLLRFPLELDASRPANPRVVGDHSEVLPEVRKTCRQ